MLNDISIRRDQKASLPDRILNNLRKKFANKGRAKQNQYIQETLKNVASFTLFTNNCIGGYFYHDAGRRFTSPTINLAFDGEDYIRFLENPKKYLRKKIEFIDTDVVDYPVGHIDDIEIRFVHYKTKEEAEQKWHERFERVDWDNIFVLATDHDGMKQEDRMERFDKLPYKNKIMYTSEEFPQYKWAKCVPQFKGRFQLKIMTNYANFKGLRYYETCFDIAKWISDNTTR